jgi:hypothetical protein
MRKTMILVVLLGAGCNTRYTPPPPPPTVPAKGKIFFPSGSPVYGGTITFKPKKEGVQAGIGAIWHDGSFTLTSYNNGDGVAPDVEYVVTVEPVSYKTGKAVTVRGIPLKYQSAQTSDLTVKVGNSKIDNLELRMR